MGLSPQVKRLRTSFAAVAGDLLVLCDETTAASLRVAQQQIQAMAARAALGTAVAL